MVISNFMKYSKEDIKKLFEMPLMDLLFKAHEIHRANHNPNKVQVSTLCSIKTGACPEDCKYCSQSAHYKTDLKKEPLMELESILEEAKKAKASGSERFCMGAAWRKLHDKDAEKACEIVREVKKLGLETCMTLGMLTKNQAIKLKEAGLDYYNHNLDTSREYYPNIITTRTYEDRLETLSNVAEAGINVCSGGILGMGETREDRISLLFELASLNPQPNSVPINALVRVKGTPLGESEPLDKFEFIRTIAIARILMPQAFVRLSAGRVDMTEEMQAMCYFAGANSQFYGEKLLTTPNPEKTKDNLLFAKLGINQ
jgi:biotin synthase